jgi:hypothetical protein
MLTPDQIEALRIQSGQIINPVVEFLISDIASRIAEAGQLTSTAAYQIWRAQNLGLSQRQLKKELRKRLKVSHRKLRELLTQAAEVGYDFDIKRFPFAQAVPFDENESLQRIVKTTADMTQESFENLTQTMGFVTYDGKATELTEAYRKSCDFAFEKIFTGAQDYNSAIRQAVKGLAEKGIQTIDYESGTHRSLEAAVRGNFMGGINIMSREINQKNHDMLGCDGWEISAHEFSAPDHEPFQGKQYSDKEFQKIQAMLVRDFGSFSCGHDVLGIILGINEPQYTPEELEAMRRRNEEGFVIDGKHYTGYEATQRQHGLERTLRKQKWKILIDEKTGDKEKLAIDQTRYVIADAEYKRFSKAAGLRLQHERANVPGFGAKQHSAAEKDTKNTLAKTPDPCYNDLQKLQYSGLATPEIEASIEESLAKIPQRHRELAETKITGVEITDSQVGSSYSPRTGMIRLSKYADPDVAIHEYAHALSESLGAYGDPGFKAVMLDGLENIGPADVILDEDTFVEPIYRIECDKFISIYQGRLYEEVGIFDGKAVSLDGMLDYFAEGYKEFILNPENLRVHDPSLFDYFEGIK